MSDVLEVKVSLSDPNYDKIFNNPMFDTLIDKINYVLREEVRLFKIELDFTPEKRGNDYNIVKFTFNAVEKNMKSGTKDYCVGGLMFNPETGYGYLSDSPLETFTPIVDMRLLLKEVLLQDCFESVTRVEKNPNRDTQLDDFWDNEFKRFLKNPKDADAILQKLKFIGSTGEINTETGVVYLDIAEDVKRGLLGGVGKDPLQENTLLGSLIAYRKSKQSPQQKTDDSFSLESYLNILESDGTFKGEWISVLLGDLYRLTLQLTALLALLNNASVPEGPLKTLVMKSEKACEGVVDLLVDKDFYETPSPYFEINFHYIREAGGIEALNANLLLNPTVRENFKAKIKLNKYIVEHDEANPNNWIDKENIVPGEYPEYDKLNSELENSSKYIKEKCKIYNITEFTDFPEDAGLVGTNVIEGASADDYNYLIEHIKDSGQSLNAMKLCSDSISSDIQTIARSKVVDIKTFDNVIKTIQEDETFGPVITLLTNKIARLIDNIYKVFNKAIN